MVRTPDDLSASGFLAGEFPPDRAAPPAWLTVPLSVLYRIGLAAHQFTRRARTVRLAVPVISVGNIVVGGSGKTPCVIALTRLLQQEYAEYSSPNAVAILSRGYGRKSHELVVVREDSDWRETGDEPLLIKRAVPNAAVVVHKDRIAAARFAMEKFRSRTILLDDGFQFRQLSRDIDFVMVNGDDPLGNGRLLPAGPLREPPSALKRATRLISVGTQSGNTNQDLGLGIPTLHSRVSADTSSLGEKQCRLFAFCGIARPERFFSTLNGAGHLVVGRKIFADHHSYSTHELEEIARRAGEFGADRVVTTAKDFVRISQWNSALDLCQVHINLEFIELAEIRRLLDAAIGLRREAM